MDDFTPTVQKTPDPTTQATVQFAQVAADTRLVTFIQKGAQLSVFQQFKKIETQAQYDQAIDAFTESKNVLKGLEDLRLSVVAVPTKFVGMVNGLFRQLKEGVDRSKAHLGTIINDKKTADEEAARLAAEAAEEKEEGPVVIEEDGVGMVQMGEEVPPPPSNVIESARGAKVHSRKDVEVTVTDLRAFLKVVSGKSKRYSWLTENFEDLVEIKMGTLKKLVKDSGKKKVPGLEYKDISKVI